MNMEDTLEKRPISLTPEMALTAAKELAAELVSDGFFEADEALRAAEQIAKHARPHMDGYELAKALDSYCYWDCNFQTTEILDGWSSLARKQIEMAEKEWAARVNPQAPLAIGARVTIPGFRGATEAGEITGIYEYGPAKYLVKMENDSWATKHPDSRRIVNFEDVAADGRALASAAGAAGEETR